MSGDDEFAGVCSALQQAEGEVASVSEFSEKIGEISELLIDISDKSQDIMYEIRSIIDDFDVDINMLDQIEERLDTYYKLKRKYGGSVEAVLEYYKKAMELAPKNDELPFYIASIYANENDLGDGIEFNSELPIAPDPTYIKNSQNLLYNK